MNLLPGVVIGIDFKSCGNCFVVNVGTSIFKWEIIPVLILSDFLVDLSIIDRSTKQSLKIKNGITSHLKIDVPTYKANKLPPELKSIPITTPGSRFIK